MKPKGREGRAQDVQGSGQRQRVAGQSGVRLCGTMQRAPVNFHMNAKSSMDSSQAPAAASLLARAASLAPYTLSTSNIDTTQPTVSDAWLSYEFDRTSLESRWVRLHRHEERRLDSCAAVRYIQDACPKVCVSFA